MPRDAEATRSRLVEAAIREFAQFGIAGGRVDRIAMHANANKAQIYHYFGSKEQMFDAAFTEIVARIAEDATFDVHDLPGYAAKLAALYEQHPEILRMATWQRLERPTDVTNPDAENSIRAKIKAIRAAQADGELPSHYPPEVLLALVLNTAATWATAGPEVRVTLPPSIRGQHIADAVRRLLAS
ncbi:MAG TPA: TetR family transcriptional regulator [Pseudonocardiaceae bacterium]|nr:TetR family transcriptional regulator [Pseudonocardiaceae bacterium]